MRAGVWSVPAVAVVAAAPAVAASTAPEIRITSIAPRGFGDRTDVFYTVDGVPTGPTRIVRVSRTPSDGSTIGPDFAVSQGPGSGSFIFVGLVPGTTYDFTVTYYVDGSPVASHSLPYTA
ncbi:hypothetical protein GCM10027215_17920 [Nocardioides zeae]